MIPRASPVLALLLGCSHAAVRERTPPVATNEPRAAAQQAASPGAPALTGAEMIEHALSRTSFGARPEDRELVVRIGIAAFLEQQLHPEDVDDATVEQRLGRFEALQTDPRELLQRVIAQRRALALDAMLADAPPPPDAGDAPPMRARGGRRGVIAELAGAKVLRAVDSRRQLREVMADFWFNHFNVFAGKGEVAALLPAYDEQVIRANALGSFPELLRATARSPAMLVYLDNWRSAAPRPGRSRGLNENYARELLELQTLGVDGGYTQKDVVEVARCFTGWTLLNPRTDPEFVFRPGMHDDGPKIVLGHVIPAGHGIEDGEEVLRILASHPSTARFIARKLARKFVSDDPPESLVARVAAAYTGTGGDIRSMLRTIFESPEFWSRDALRAKVRSPLEVVAASLRALEAKVDDPVPLAAAIARMGEPLYLAQAPTGYPDRAQTWLASGALLSRIDFGLQLAAGRLPGTSVDLSTLAAASPEDTLQRAAAVLGAGELSGSTRGYVLEELRRASDRLAAPRAVALLLGAPELQRR